MNNDSYLKLREVVALTSISRSTIYRYMQSGDFPESHRITKGRVAWLKSEIEEWFEKKRSTYSQPNLSGIEMKLNEVFGA